jgi:hypothetical protein
VTRPRAAAFLVFGAFLATGLLMSGWSGLEMRLPGGLPAGNALSAAALILPAGAGLLLSRRGSWPRTVSVAALVLALLWLPVSVALAGNLDLNFTESTGPAWFAFSALVLVASFGALLAAFASTVLRRKGPGQA